MKVSINLWGLLAKKKMTVKKLAEITGMTEQQLGAIKNNKTKKISFDTIEKFLKVFECSIQDLFIVEDNNGEKK